MSLKKTEGNNMTNKEAIKMLRAKLYCIELDTRGARDCNERNCNHCPYNYEQGNMGEQKQALDIAIKALEQEPCEDYVSRQAALDAVRKNTFRLTFAEEQGSEGHTAWSAEAVYSDVIEGALLELPSARPKTKWIPIVERPLTDEERKEYDNEYDANIEFMYDCELPEDNQEVLISTPYSVVQTTFCSDNGYYFENYEGAGEVIAWRPLPEPYKSESEG